MHFRHVTLLTLVLTRGGPVHCDAANPDTTKMKEQQLRSLSSDNDERGALQFVSNLFKPKKATIINEAPMPPPKVAPETLSKLPKTQLKEPAIDLETSFYTAFKHDEASFSSLKFLMWLDDAEKVWPNTYNQKIIDLLSKRYDDTEVAAILFPGWKLTKTDGLLKDLQKAWINTKDTNSVFKAVQARNFKDHDHPRRVLWREIRDIYNKAACQEASF